ncbi:MAG: hypothetical protein ACI837_000117 [Crocinitomicaceae bacterium]|jgi:hypothetical protein
MKYYILIISGAILLASCASEKEAGGINKMDVKLGKSYGPISVNIDNAVEVDGLKIGSTTGDTSEFTFQGTITEVCAKAGCWVSVDKGDGETFMVRFKDHFTIPPDTKPGTVAYFHGVAFNDSVPVDLLQHFAEDAGKSPEEIAEITEPKFELGFTADGIVLKK